MGKSPFECPIREALNCWFQNPKFAQESDSILEEAREKWDGEEEATAEEGEERV